jgi:molybdate transport system substrate-binding protein
MQIRLAAVALISIVTGSSVDAGAAEIKVLSSGNMMPILAPLVTDFERATGHKLLVDYGSAGQMRKRLQAGEAADVAIVQRSIIDDLAKQGRITAGSIVNIASSSLAVVVRAGTPKPDMSSVDALRKSLLAAESIAYSNPASGGLSSNHFASLVERLGIAEQLKSKTILLPPPGAGVSDLVGKGGAAIGVVQVSDAFGKPSVEFVGPLAKELQVRFVVAAGVVIGALEPDAAKALMAFLSSPPAADAIRSKGMEPG